MTLCWWISAAMVGLLAVRTSLLQHVFVNRPGLPLTSWDGKVNLTGSTAMVARSTEDIQRAVWQVRKQGL
jgi:hypothetical protein